MSIITRYDSVFDPLARPGEPKYKLKPVQVEQQDVPVAAPREPAVRFDAEARAVFQDLAVNLGLQTTADGPRRFQAEA